MKLFLMRHGRAMERDEALAKGQHDHLRPLVEVGRVKSSKMIKHLAAELKELDILVSSPLLRAQQTAQVVTQIVKPNRYFESAELTPEAPPQAFAQWLKLHAGQARSVMAVGHEPQLSVFASWLLSGYTSSFVDLKKSGLIHLELESFEQMGPRSAELKWILCPKIL